ncbi:MAG: hypothetical protein H6627_01910 [Calditrichae bacterium]|nr:hypothetical protein [Calditrichia bacterium]
MAKISAKLIIAVSLIFTTFLQAQWQQTNGPFGGALTVVGHHKGDIYAATSRGAIFRNQQGEWQSISHISYVEQFISFKDQLFARGYNGLYRSQDDGLSWQLLNPGSASAFYSTNDVLYAAVNDTIYKSTDGSDWQPALLSTSANTILFDEPTVQQLVDITAFAIADSVALLGCTTSVYPIPQGIYITGDKGENWQFPEGIKEPTYARDFKMYNGAFYMGSNFGVFKTEDQGRVWQAINQGLPTGNIDKLLALNNQLYALSNSDRSLYQLSDTTWSLISINLSIYDISTDGTDIFLLSNGSLYQFSLDDNSVTDITPGLIATSLEPFVVDDEIVLAGAYDRWYRTADGGDNWTELTEPLLRQFVLKEQDMFAVGPQGIYHSTDKGQTWGQAQNGIPPNYQNYSNTVSSVGPYIFAGFSKLRARDHLTPIWEAGGIYRSADNGKSWTAASVGLPSEGAVKTPIYTILACDDHLIIKTYSGLYRSVDNGDSWSAFSDGMSQNNFVIRYSGFEDRIFAITSKGIYYSQADKSEWQSLNNGFPDIFDQVDVYYYRFLRYKGNLYLVNTMPGGDLYQLQNEALG